MSTYANTKSGTNKSLSFFRRDSLIKQASLDRVQNEGLRRQNTLLGRQELERQALCKPVRLIGHCIELIRTASDEKVLCVVLSLHCSGDSRTVLQSALANFSSIGLRLGHLDTRPDLDNPDELEIRAQLSGRKAQFLEALTKLVVEKAIERIELSHFIGQTEEEKDKKTETKLGRATEIWFPRHVSELDKSTHVLVKYEPTEDPKHPGFGDQQYIARRAELNALANGFRHGDSLPFICYTDEENNTWRVAYEQLKELRETHTCEEYQRNIREMEREEIITADRIPQLRSLSLYIQRRTGFELRPCGGLLSARDFLASLAFRVFQATLYVRHASSPHHCPEPDVIHEVLGHCPMFADEHLAQMSQEIGLLSLGASDEQIERLATVYWFIVEFGLCRQNGQLRAIGAGLLSAFGELKFACSDGPGHELFVAELAALRSYADSDYQPVYFVAESIRKAMESIRAYALSMRPQKINIYHPLSRSIQSVPSHALIGKRMGQLQKECTELSQLMDKMKTEEEKGSD
ncbi:hypothetical protein niasHT_022635 [Heterodera trifolii]|uniref:Biopterin-dependent aromatic amino acid hydroxylase family profile domain-containing protein n=1 Tax=Heterodera trifolii TaxID=157864 RepID=A0ABD2JRC1_9BILA